MRRRALKINEWDCFPFERGDKYTLEDFFEFATDDNKKLELEGFATGILDLGTHARTGASLFRLSGRTFIALQNPGDGRFDCIYDVTGVRGYPNMDREFKPSIPVELALDAGQVHFLANVYAVEGYLLECRAVLQVGNTSDEDNSFIGWCDGMFAEEAMESQKNYDPMQDDDVIVRVV